MKNILLIGVLFLTMSAKPSINSNLDFLVLKAEKQVYYGGVAGSPVVSSYVLYAKANRSFYIKVDSGWAEGKVDRAIMLNDSGKPMISHRLLKGEIIRIQVQIKTASPSEGNNHPWQMEGSKPAKSPCGVKNSFCVRYKSDKRNYLTTNNIKTLTPIYGQ